MFAGLTKEGRVVMFSHDQADIREHLECFQVQLGFEPLAGIDYIRADNKIVPDMDRMKRHDMEEHRKYSLETNPAWVSGVDLPEPKMAEDSLSPPLVYPDAFAQLVYEESRRLPTAPSLELVRHSVSSLYFASLEKEEQISYALRIELIPRTVFEESDMERNVSLFRLKRPLPLTPANLIKLGPAIDPGQTSILAQESNGQFEIWGMVARGRSLHNSMMGETSQWSAVGPHPVLLRSRAPGHLVAEVLDYRVGEYKSGAVVTDYLPIFRDDGPLRRFLDSKKLGTAPCRLSILPIIQRLVRRAVDFGHGGIIVIADIAEYARLSESDHDIFQSKYDIALSDSIAIYRNSEQKSRRWSRAKAAQNESSPSSTLDLSGPHIGPRTFSADEVFKGKIQELSNGRFLSRLASHWAAADEMAARNRRNGNMQGFNVWKDMLQSSERAVRDAEYAIGSLASPDGALLLGTDLSVLGFGVMIRNVGNVTEIYKARDVAASRVERFDLTSFGTRHQSAAWLASQMQSGLIFVMSEDETITALMRWRGKTIAWRPVTIDNISDGKWLEEAG
ncbi:hypothetical protein LOC68_27050 [Blastopirellula sp. JC732]|uniref:Probable sensor domain-containing protein n=1 Tax=Blastopirellula sediminis TaxID=2894196 RepID=A0A9X1SIX3_9BACT|nr:hypothetical protein [Blastopirellula sediminis]MCC9604633.1 hypothetical protein [Blastopirellula sediminis]MCC9632068.1 hypothetical protein [Blastopirellula sediminis]